MFESSLPRSLCGKHNWLLRRTDGMACIGLLGFAPCLSFVVYFLRAPAFGDVLHDYLLLCEKAINPERLIEEQPRHFLKHPSGGRRKLEMVFALHLRREGGSISV